MKKKEIYVGKVSSLAFPNKGTVRVDDEKVIVKNTIPGQTVSFILSKNRPGTKEGRLVEILERSPWEIESECPVHDRCGGCIYQTLPYERELKLKESQIHAMIGQFLTEHGQEAAENLPEPIIPSPVCSAYRNKMEFSFGNEYKDGPVTLGMHVAGRFNDIVDTPDCNIVDEDMRRIRQTVIDYFRETGLPFYHRSRGDGCLRHLLLRRGIKTGELMLALVTTSFYEISEEEFTERLLKLQLQGEIVGILHIVNDGTGDVIKNENIKILYGRDYFYDEVSGLRFRITPFSFFQTNTLGAELLYKKAAEYAEQALGKTENKVMSTENPRGAEIMSTKAGVIFDLYSGTGTIAQIMAKHASLVIGVEIVPEAVEAAGENARLNGIENVRFQCGDVLQVLEETEELPDLIIMDPPREGASPKALSKILSYGVKNIVYISCKPTSLIRDLHSMYEWGYRLVKAAPVDMFPRTGNVETVALLSKLSEAKHHIEVKVDMDELDITSAEAKATYKEIEEWVQENYGFHVTNLNIAQVKQMHGIIERENYNKPKSPDSKQPGYTEEKVKAIEDAMRHFQMI